MARTARGKGRRATPIVTAGLSDFAWKQNGQMSKAHGVFFDTTGLLRKSGGLREYVTWSPNPFKDNFITAMTEFRIPRGPSELVVAWAGNVGYLRRDGVPAANRFLTGRHDPPTPADGDRFAVYNDWLYVFNGRDANMKWNGDYAAPVGVGESPPPPSAQRLEDTSFVTDYSLDHSGDTQTFRYRSTFINSSGHEGPPSVAGAHATVGGGAGRAVIRIALGEATADDLLFTNIYKQAVDGSYYFWRQVSVHETVVYDHEEPLSSASEGSPLSESLQAPPVSRFVSFFRGRGYYVPSDFPSFVFYSDSGFPEQLSSGFQFLDVSSGDGEEITGLVQLEDSLLIFKPTSIWQVSTLADGTPVLTPVAEGIGCVAAASLKVSRGRVVFVGQDGIYEYDGGQARPLTNELTRWWGGVDRGALRNAVAAVDEMERRLYVAVPADDSSWPSVVLTYHYDVGGWTLLPGYRITAATSYKDNLLFGLITDAGVGDIVLFGVSDSVEIPDYNTGDGTAKGTDVGAATIHGEARFGPFNQYETAWAPDELMEIVGVTVYFERTDNSSLLVSLYKDRNPVAAETKSFSMQKSGFKTVQSANEDLTTHEGWGGKDWGQSTWGGARQLQQHVMFDDSVLCREFEIGFSNANPTDPFAIAGFIVWRIERGSEQQR